jgi:hypothetical protein
MTLTIVKPSQPGLVAILDALGAASYSDVEITKFLQSRARVLALLEQKSTRKNVTTFTFNDTVLIVLRTASNPTIDDVHTFCELLRRFEMNSLEQGILFRGSFSIGTFYVDDESNTVMGSAVTDAAAWYDAADWIGINATPKASLIIDGLNERNERKLDNVLLPYEVPLRTGATLPTRAINWPKGFVVKGIRPEIEGATAKEKFLKLLTRHAIPKGTEA